MNPLTNNNKIKRPTIGLFFDFITEKYQTSIWNGIVDRAEEKDVNIVCFLGGPLSSPEEHHKPRNAIYNLIDHKKIDGLIIMSATIGNFINTKELTDFHNKFLPIPIVSLGSLIENTTSILIDNAMGMQELVEHLIINHEYNKIAFIKGTDGNTEAELRFNSYKKALKKHNIQFNPDLICPGDFYIGSGKNAVSLLLDDRKIEIDAIVSSNDFMAIEAIDELKKRNIHIPYNIAVVGFDNIDEGEYIRPPLTTVSQPLYEIGITAIDAILSMINKENIDNKIILPTKVKIRRSCGCYKHEMTHFIIQKVYEKIAVENKDHNLNLIEDLISKEVIDFINNQLNMFNKNTHNKKWPELIYRTIINDIKGKSDDNFIFILNDLIIHYDKKDINVLHWWDLISSIFNKILYYLKSKEDIDHLNDLFSKTLEIIWENIENKEFTHKMETDNLLRYLHRISIELITSFNLEKIKNIIAEELPKIGIKKCFIFKYLDNNLIFSRSFFGFSSTPDSTNTKIDLIGKKINSSSFLNDIINDNDKFTYIVMALYFKTEQLGFIVFDAAKLEGIIYETLTIQISAALKGTLLLDKIKNHAEELEIVVEERTKELEIKNEKLKKLDTLKNDFIANITHDFKSPLTIILNTADLALKFDKNIDEENKDNYNIIFNSSIKLKNTIDRLLDLAKMDAQGMRLKITKINIKSFLNSIINYYTSSLINTNIKIINKFPLYEIDNLYIDKEKLEEVINNIISNAIKFVDMDKGIIEIELIDKDDSILIIITDNGIGIPEDKLTIIFNRFEQLEEVRNRKYGGTGIGLAFSKQLIEYMKGDIWAESKGINKGAKFFIKLIKGNEFFNKQDIVEEERIIQKKEIKKLIEIDLHKKLKKDQIQIFYTDLNGEDEFDYKKGIILVIDDDENVTKIVMKYLTINGYKNFIISNNGKIGLNAIYENSPDLIICDYNMPDIKGNEIHEEILNNPKYKNIPFIFLSAISDRNIINERRQRGASSYLKKPIDEKDLILTIEHHLKKHFEFLKTLQLAALDELTGLYNRREILKRFMEELSIRKYRDISLIFLDIDYFKDINDKYGHQCGDKILKEIGIIIKETLRDYDIPGRYGGDEFIILMPNTNLESAKKVSEILKNKISSNKIEYNELIINVTSSFGIASLIDNSNYIIEQLKIENLKNIFEIYDPKQTNWQQIKSYKQQIADILLNMADTSLYKAKATLCTKCNYSSEKISNFINNTCPKCNSDKLIKGRNKIIVYNSEDYL